MAPAVAPKSLTLDIKSQLIQDYIYVADPPPLALSETGSMIAIGGGVVAVNNDHLVSFQRDSHSQSGWRATRITIATPQTAVERGIVSIFGFENRVGSRTTSNVLCLLKAKRGFAVVWLVRVADHQWREVNLSVDAASLLSQVTSLDYIDTGSTGVFVYGITAPIPNSVENNARLFMLFSQDLGPSTGVMWDAGTQVEVHKFGCSIGAAPRFSFLTKGVSGIVRDQAIVWWDTNLAKATVSWAPVSFGVRGFDEAVARHSFTKETLDGPILSLHSSMKAITSADLWPALVIQGNSAAPGSKNLYEIGFPKPGGNLARIPLMPGADTVQQYLWADERLSLFSISTATGTLNLLRKIDPAPRWVDLGNKVRAIAAPVTSVDAGVRPVLEIFYAAKASKTALIEGISSPTYDIFHMSQDMDGQQWIVHKVGDVVDDAKGVASGKIPPHEVSSIAIDLTVQDERKFGVAKARLRFQSNQWANLIANDLSYWVGPGHDGNVTTDGAGKISIRIEADTLKFPKIVFTAESSGLSATRWCQGDMVEPSTFDSWPASETTVASRLAGKDPSFPLQDKMKTSSASLLPAGSTDKEVRDLTDMLNTIGTWMEHKHQGTTFALEQPRVWRLERRASGFSCQALLWDGIHTTDLPGGFFSDIWGDITHFAKHALSEIGDWVVKVEKGALAVTVKIAGRDIPLIAHTLQAAGDLVETIFSAIRRADDAVVDFVKEVVAFFKMLFDWDDILEMHKVLRHVSQWCFKMAEIEIGSIDKLIRTKIKEVFGKLDDDLKDLKGRFANQDKSMSVNDAIKRSNNGKGAIELSGPIQKAHSQNVSRCDYVTDRAKIYMSKLTLANPIDSAASGFFDECLRLFEGPQIILLVDHLKKRFAGLKLADPKAIIDVALYELLEGFEEAIKFSGKALIDIVDLFFLFIEDIVQKLDALLFSGDIEIPVITYLYKKMTHGDKLTLSDLLTLALAVPLTIIGKIINRNKKVTSIELITDLQKLFYFDKSSAKLDLGSLVAVSTAATPSPDRIYKFMLYGAAMTNAVSSWANYKIDQLQITEMFAGSPKVVVDPILAKLAWWSGSICNLFSMPISLWASWVQKGETTGGGWAYTAWYGITWIPVVLDGICTFSADGKPMRSRIERNGYNIDWILGAALTGGTVVVAVWAWLIEGIINIGDLFFVGSVGIARIFRYPYRFITPADEVDALTMWLILGGDIATGVIGSAAALVDAYLIPDSVAQSLHPST